MPDRHNIHIYFKIAYARPHRFLSKAACGRRLCAPWLNLQYNSTVTFHENGMICNGNFCLKTSFVKLWCMKKTLLNFFFHEADDYGQFIHISRRPLVLKLLVVMH